MAMLEIGSFQLYLTPGRWFDSFKWIFLDTLFSLFA
jgi:hypothetical protein